MNVNEINMEKLIKDILKREECRDCLKNIKGKKIVAFGATLIAEEIMKCVL